MALDVLRHRLVLSFEALSDNVTQRRIARRRSSTASPSRSCHCVSTPTSASTPERILQRLDWQVIRRLDGLLQGDYRSLFHGNGVDFADLREYQPGDDVRYIDWNVTARMDTPYVREYVEDREITAWFLLDLSPSVDFGTAETERLKRTRADRLRDDARPAADAARQPGRRDLLRRPGRADDPGARRPDPGPAPGQRPARAAASARRAPFTDLTPLLEAGQHSIKRRSLVFVISDFISAPGWERPLQPAHPATRGAGHPPVRPARGRAARRRAADHGGRRDRRAALRRHARQGLPAALPRGGATGARRP